MMLMFLLLLLLLRECVVFLCLFEKKNEEHTRVRERNEKTSSTNLFRAGEIEKREKNFFKRTKFPYTHAASFATHTTHSKDRKRVRKEGAPWHRSRASREASKG
jgi:C4-dicarboxylate-specific signal transduction histidine kinase